MKMAIKREEENIEKGLLCCFSFFSSFLKGKMRFGSAVEQQT